MKEPATTTTTTTTDEWAPCDAGQLQNLGKRLRSQHNRATAVRALGGAAAAAVALVAIGLWSGASPDGYGELSCEQCMAQMSSYNDDLTGIAAMPAADAGAVAAHLEACPLCREKFEQQYPGVLSGAAAAGVGWLLLTARRPRV